LDVNNRNEHEDERLDLNCAWYADVLRILTENVTAVPTPK
jgi:hypothetical protein